jgi:hypothetical protein
MIRVTDSKTRCGEKCRKKLMVLMVGHRLSIIEVLPVLWGHDFESWVEAAEPSSRKIQLFGRFCEFPYTKDQLVPIFVQFIHMTTFK